MAKVEVRGRELLLKLSEKELNGLELNPDSDYELLKGKKGIYMLVEKELSEAEKLQRMDERIFSLIRGKNLSERVEGKFEKLLGKEELKRFKELLKEGKVIPFKLSKKYKKAVYKLPEARKKESENPDAGDKPIEDYSLEKDGFLVAKNEERAKKISMDLQERIRGGSIRGLKSFDGNFYIIENALYEKYRPVVLQLLEASSRIELDALKKSVNISPTLAKIVCEFLKDEGELIERRKNQYQFVK